MFSEYEREFSTTHNRLINGLLKHGLEFNNFIKRDGENIVLLTSCDDVVIISSSGSVELVSENTNPYEPNDTGNHAWTLWANDEDKEVDFLISTITRVTGDD